MRIAYLYNQPIKAADHMNAESKFADYPTTKRAELIALVDRGGLVRGDVLVVTKMSALGHGAAAKRMRERIERMGVTIEVSPCDADLPKKFGRWRRVKPEQRALLCDLWYSPAEPEHVLHRANDVLGRPIDRNAMNYMCGPRDGSKRKA